MDSNQLSLLRKARSASFALELLAQQRDRRLLGADNKAAYRLVVRLGSCPARSLADGTFLILDQVAEAMSHKTRTRGFESSDGMDPVRERILRLESCSRVAGSVLLA